MTPNLHGKLRVRIFVEEWNDGMVWVPYKTLIGYRIRNRPIIGRLWETIYASDEFASKTEAVEKAKNEAGVRIMELFGHVKDADISPSMCRSSTGISVQVGVASYRAHRCGPPLRE